MNEINNNSMLCSDCTGCGACTAICSKNAISLNVSNLGFWYATVNKEKCVECGLCTKMCRMVGTSNLPQKVYAVRHKNYKELLSSRSGAFFVSLAEYIFSKNGSVYGAAMDKEFKVEHIRICNNSSLSLLKKSKYTQSYISKSVFEQLIDDASKGMYVLFTGTGCQVAKAKHLLAAKKIDLTRVYFMDIICHGVPTPKLWKDYINYIQDRNKVHLVSADFRDKSVGWSKHFESLTFKRFRLSVKTFSNLYTKLFYSNYFLRESCFVCKYANLDRHSDFTIGDFWGWEKACPEFNSDDYGVSLVLANTTKAVSVFNQLSNSLNSIDCTDKDYLQPNLQKPTSKPANYEKMQFDYEKLDFKNFVEKYGYESKIKRMKRLSFSVYMNIKALL